MIFWAYHQALTALIDETKNTNVTDSEPKLMEILQKALHGKISDPNTSGTEIFQPKRFVYH